MLVWRPLRLHVALARLVLAFSIAHEVAAPLSLASKATSRTTITSIHAALALPRACLLARTLTLELATHLTAALSRSALATRLCALSAKRLIVHLTPLAISLLAVHLVTLATSTLTAHLVAAPLARLSAHFTTSSSSLRALTTLLAGLTLCEPSTLLRLPLVALHALLTDTSFHAVPLGAACFALK